MVGQPSPAEVIKAYRSLYRGLLHAVQYSAPARFVARDKLRTAFRTDDPATFNPAKISRTLEFLGYATKEAGLEHRLVKNMLHAAYTRGFGPNNMKSPVQESDLKRHLRKTSRIHYQMTIAMLNNTMGLCLR